MSSTSVASTPAYNPFVLSGIILVAVLFAIGVTAYNVMALGALGGLIVFVLFVRSPELGVYLTTALLLLQGSQGVVGVMGERSALALTYAQLAGAAAMGAWLVSLLLRREPLHWNPTLTYFLAFCLWALFGTIVSYYAPDLLPHWARMVFRFALLVLAVNVLNDAKKLNRYLHVLLVCAIITSLISVAQYTLPSMQLSGLNWASATGTSAAFVDPESLQGAAAVRVSGQAGHSNWLAMILLLLLPINAYWYTTTHRRWAKLLIIACAVLQVSALVLTFARIGLIIGAAVVGMLFAVKLLRLTPLRLFVFLLAGIGAFLLLPNAYKERVLSPRQYVASQSVQARLALQGAAARYTVENPIFGLGTGGFGMQFVHESSETATQMRYVVQYQNWQAVFIGTHNMFLQILSDMGLVGFGFFVALYYFMIRNLTRARAHYRVLHDHMGEGISNALLISLIAFLLCAVFLHALHQPIWWMIAAAAIAVPLHKIDFRKDPVTTLHPTPILLAR